MQYQNFKKQIKIRSYNASSKAQLKIIFPVMLQ